MAVRGEGWRALSRASFVGHCKWLLCVILAGRGSTLLLMVTLQTGGVAASATIPCSQPTKPPAATPTVPGSQATKRKAGMPSKAAHAKQTLLLLAAAYAPHRWHPPPTPTGTPC